jgi:hypothetical protein
MFKYFIRSKLTRKYYGKRLRRFFDFIQFEVEIKDIENRCNDFAEIGKSKSDWVFNQIVRFLQFQRGRVEKEDEEENEEGNSVECPMDANLNAEWDPCR